MNKKDFLKSEKRKYLIKSIVHLLGALLIISLFFIAEPKNGNKMIYVLWVLVGGVNVMMAIDSFSNYLYFKHKKTEYD